MSSQLSREFKEALQLEQRGIEHPEAVYIALEHAQEELCYDTGFQPSQFFSIENTFLQCYCLPNNNTRLNENNSLRLAHALLHYSVENRIPSRVIHFNYHSGENMVRTHTYEDCSVQIDDVSVPCFSVATLSLHNLDLLSVIFARIH